MTAQHFISQGVCTSLVLKTLEINRSSWYYKPKPDALPKGIKVSTHTSKWDGIQIPNEQVVDDIRALLSEEFVDYGYFKVTKWLARNKGYQINKKKVYRLMTDTQLIKKSIPKQPRRRLWVSDFVPRPSLCFSHLEIDIKYHWVAGENRNVQTLTVIDVKSRWVLGQLMDYSLRHPQVKELFDQIFMAYPMPKSFYVRCDNGSQFIEQSVQRYFEKAGVKQEFCQPATPQQNAHIESYHSIVEKVICQRYEFNSLIEAQQCYNRFIIFYNYRRIHSGIGYLSPYDYLLSMDEDIQHEQAYKPLNCIPEKSRFFT